MAESKQVIALQIDAKVGDAVAATKTLKQQLKEATNEAQQLAAKYGDTSKEAINAAKKTAILKEKLADFKGTVDALNPEAKFKAIGQVAQGIAGGFTAATGAMALFGVKSEDTEKALLKVQGALALSEGLNTIMGLGDAFTNLKTVAVNAFNAIKGAIGGTGIGLLVIAIGLAINEYIKWSDAIGETEKRQTELNKKLKKQSDLIDEVAAKNKKQRDFEAEYLKAQGLSEDALTAKKIANLVAEQKENTKSYNAKEELFLKQRELTQYYFKQGQKDKQEESAKEETRLQEELKKLIENKKTINNQLDLIDAAYNTQKEKEEAEKEEANKEKRIAQAKKDKEKLDALKKKNEIDSIKSIKLEKNNLNKELLDLDIKGQEESLQAEIDRIEKGKQLREAERQAKLSIAQSTVDGLASIGTIFIKDSKKLEKYQKGIALAQIAVDTAKAISSLVAYSNANPLNSVTFGAAGIAQYATGIVSILANIAKAKQLLTGGSGTSTPSLGGGGGGGGSNIPTSNASGGANLGGATPNQQSTLLQNANINSSSLNQNYVKAVVVETDITDAQNRIQGIQNKSKFG